MDDGTDEKDAPARRRRRDHPVFWPVVIIGFLAGIAGVLTLGLTGRVLSAPEWVVSRVEARANAALAGEASVRVDGLEVLVDTSFVPHVRLSGVHLLARSGAEIAVLPDLRTTLHAQPVLRGKLQPRTLRITGAQAQIRRLADGSFDFAPATSDIAATAPGLAETLDTIDRAFELPVLSQIESISVDGLDLHYEDLRARQAWEVGDGRIDLRQDADNLSIALGFSLKGRGESAAQADLVFASDKRSPGARLTARVAGVSARDLAAQSPALAWLGALDAPISGTLSTSVDSGGKVEPLLATLEIGAGALQPTPDTRPVRFDMARVGMSYDPASGRFGFSDLAVDSPSLKARADGTALLRASAEGVPESIDAQVRITDLQADPEGVFADPISFSEGAFDARLELSPFRLRIGQFVLVEDGHSMSARGEIAAAPAGWQVALDLAVDEIAATRLLALWPVSVVPKTRAWLTENVATGLLRNVQAALRMVPGEEPRLSLGYDFDEAEVTFLKTLPPVQNGSGYSTIDDYVYTLVVERGWVAPPQGGRIDVANSVLKVPDIRVNPAIAEISLETDSTITGALSLLDQPPFRFLSKSERPVDIAEGRARLHTDLTLPLVKAVQLNEVGYRVTGTLHDMRSDRLVDGHTVQAAQLSVRADPSGMEISGPGTLSGVGFDVVWRQGFAEKDRGKSQVRGTIDLSPAFVATFAPGLPKGAVTGSGRAALEIDLAKGTDAEFRLTSDLAGIRLSIPELAWSSSEKAKGSLAVEGALGRPAMIRRIALDASGLKAEGKVGLRADGALERAEFDRVRVGDWFEGAVDLVGQGTGKPLSIAVRSGSADMRRAEFGASAAGEGAGTTLDVALDRVQVSSGIALTAFRGNLTTKGGVSGQFSGRVNGQAPVTGTVVPFKGRSGFRIQSDAAGETLASAGLYSRGKGGKMTLTLTPSGGEGEYDGALDIEQIRVVGAPVLAELLGAVSVIGLLEQLNGNGIVFTHVDGEFRLTPNAVGIHRGSAVGASLGVSAAGTYDIAGDRMDIQGTISPIYLVNGVGQIFSKRGEGLFGFNYRLTGASDAPKVKVNPLSILTPGMFREIFRRAPPKLSE